MSDSDHVDDEGQHPLEPLLQAYLDDELSDEERAQVDAALETDAAARQVLEELIALSGDLRGLLSAREQTAVEVRVPGLRVPAAAAAAAAAQPAAAQPAPPQPDEQAGQEVATGYRVVRQLAKGGFGTVYLAHQISLDRPVALKVMAPELSANAEYVQRFLREAKLAATLKHPNLVSIFDVQHEGDQLYYSMEYVDGEDAEEVIKREGFVPQRRAAEIAAEVAGALHAVSSKGIVHRDIKPANLLLTATKVKLADLGLARGEGPGNAQLTMNRKVIGSPNYMSPEQAQDLRKATAKSDVYSLGATLLHLVTGDVPFGRGSAVEIIARVLREPPHLPDVLPSGEKFDPALKAIVADCLAKDPEARPTPEGLQKRLNVYLSGAVTASGRRSTGRSGRKSARLSESGRRGSKRTTSRARTRKASSDSGSQHAAVAASKTPMLVAAAAGILLLLGLGFWAMGSGDPADTGGSNVALKDGDAPETKTPPPSDEPRRGPRRAGPEVDEPEVRAEPEAPEVAALEAFWRENPDAAGEAYRRAEALLALFPGEDSAANRRASAVRDASSEALDEELNSLRGRSDAYAQRGELWEARTQYLEFVNRHGEENPAAKAAQRALSAIDVQVAVELEEQLDTLDGLLAEGKVDEAEALLAKVRTAAGPEGRAQAESKLTAFREQNPRDPVAAADPNDTGAAKDPEPKPDGPSAEERLAARKAEAEELLAAARGKLDAGDADGAEELLAKLREDFKDVESVKEGSNELAQAITAHRTPKEPEILAAFFRAKTVEVGSEGQVTLTYTFENELEALDWVDDELRRGGRSQAVAELLEEVGPKIKGPEPWSVRKKTLLGFGWGRREMIAPFRRDRELTFDVKASGKRNVVVGFNKNESKALLVAFNFLLDDMPIGPLGERLKAEKVGSRDGYLRQLYKLVERSQEAGSEVAVFNEDEGLLGKMDKVFGQRVHPKSKLSFSATLAPHDFDEDDDGEEDEDAEWHEHALTLKIGRRVGKPIGVPGGPWARPVLVGFGYPVSFQEIVVSGTLTEGFRNRLKELAGKGSLEDLRKRFDAEEQKSNDQKREEQEKKDRKRRAGK